MDGEKKNNPKTKMLQYQDRLPFWDDDFYEQANPLLRSAVFACTGTREHYAEYTPVRVIGDGEILYRGHRLNTFDEDVFLQLLHYMRGQPLTAPLVLDRKQLLTDLGYTPGGTAYRLLDASLNRLDSAKMKITSGAALKKLCLLLARPDLVRSSNPEFAAILSKNFQKLTHEIIDALEHGHDFFLTVGFIQNNAGSSAGRLVINIDPLNILLYDGINTTRISRHERRLLSSAEKKLHAFVMSHSKGVYDMNIETYHEMMGSQDKNMRKFKMNLRKYLATMERLKRIEPGWEITRDNKVIGVKPKPYE